MSDRAVEGIERAVFGAVTEGWVDQWLNRLVRSRLSTAVHRVLFRSGRISAVYGLELAGGARVVVKVHRGQPDLASLAAAVACQRWLARRGYPAPAPIDGPTVYDGHPAVIESLLDSGAGADGHDPVVRRALARSLADQIGLLAGAGALAAGLTARPAWAIYDHGPWPTPHDPIFDFTSTPQGYRWLDVFARAACDVLAAARLPPSLGHGDWGSGNVRLTGSRVTSTFDWDSLLVESEAVLVGFAAGSFTAETAPDPGEVRAFLIEYARCRFAIGAVEFDAVEQSVAVNAASWVLSYNARCELAFLDPAAWPPTGSYLAALRDHREDYRTISW